MKKKLSFKEYLDSKKSLKEALKRDSLIKSTYVVETYCRLSVGTKEEKETILLKPGESISVFWSYKNQFDEVPTPTLLEKNNRKFDLHWNNNKLSKWLKKNTQK